MNFYDANSLQVEEKNVFFVPWLSYNKITKACVCGVNAAHRA